MFRNSGGVIKIHTPLLVNKGAQKFFTTPDGRKYELPVWEEFFAKMLY
jgi:hypothetical protein